MKPISRGWLGRGLCLLVAGALVSLTPAAVAAGGPGDPAPADQGAVKDSLAASGSWDLVGPAPAHSGAWRAQEAAKLAAARKWEAGRPGGLAALQTEFGSRGGVVVNPNMCPPDYPNCNTGTPPASYSLVANQVAQATNYWCAPAAVYELLNAIGISSTQSGLATKLKTTTAGTAWYGVYVDTSPSTGWPVEDILNYKVGSSFYNSIPVNSTPTSTQKTDFQTRLKADVYSSWPLIGNAWEIPGYPHLVGHPVNKEIYHYFEMRGYSSSGATTMYEDTVHNATTVSWYAGVPAYSNLASDTIATIVGGRGYVW